MSHSTNILIKLALDTFDWIVVLDTLPKHLGWLSGSRKHSAMMKRWRHCGKCPSPVLGACPSSAYYTMPQWQRSTCIKIRPRKAGWK